MSTEEFRQVSEGSVTRPASLDEEENPTLRGFF
jgi:hypothetical protein